MVHDLDIIMALIKDDVKLIRSSGIHVLSEKIDIANARLEFESGCVATFIASRVHQGKVRKLRIFEPTSYYSIDYIDQEVKVFPLNGRQTDIKTLKIKKEEPLKKELQNFIRCVKTREKPIADFEAGHRAVTACHLANIAILLRRKIVWDPQKERIVGDDEANSLLRRRQRPPYLVRG